MIASYSIDFLPNGSRFEGDDAVTLSGIHRYPATETVVFGRPAADAVRDQLEQSACRRVFIVSGRSLAGMSDGPLQKIRAALGGRVAGSFLSVRAHTPREDILAAAALARSAGADVLLAVGGGSVIDATKAMLMCLWMGLERTAQMSPYEQQASDRQEIVAPVGAMRMISVSTTLSAAEFTSIAGITESETRTKQLFGHRLFAPRVVVLDPECTRHTPAALLYATAVRSIDHAVETCCSPAATPATEPASLQGLRLLVSALRRMAGAPFDASTALEAQFGMWQAIAPVVAGVPTGASHGIGYALGSGFGVGHGETSCVMLPAVLEWNAGPDAAKQRVLAEAMGRPGMSAGAALRELVTGLGLPSRLSQVGIRRGDFDEIAARALRYPQLAQNVVPVTTEAQVRQILELAW